VTAMMTAKEVLLLASQSLIDTLLQEFLKRLLSFTQVQRKPIPSLRTIHTPELAPVVDTDVQLVTTEDIHHTIVTRPYLLGEDLSVNLEKVSMLL